MLDFCLDPTLSVTGSLCTALDHWFLLIVLPAVLILGLKGSFGGGLGIRNLFHDDSSTLGADWRNMADLKVYRNSPSFYSQLSLLVFFALIWSFAYVIEHSGAEEFPIAAMGPTVAWQSGVYGLLSLFVAARAELPKGTEAPNHLMRRAIGAAIGFGLGWVFVALTGVLIGAGIPPLASVLGLAIALFAFLTAQPRLLPIVAMIGLIGGFAALYTFLASFAGQYTLLILIAFAIFIGLMNGASLGFGGSGKKAAPLLKFSIPGLSGPDGPDHYTGTRFDLATFDAEPTTAAKPDLNLVHPTGALKAAADKAGEDAKPRLFMVATSGGAFRASFWTALVLDRIAEMDRAADTPTDICRNVRLITGASGGMVGAAYFAAMAKDGPHDGKITDQIKMDVHETQSFSSNIPFPYKSTFPTPRDCLSPVAQQLLQSDLPGLFVPKGFGSDRGKVLEDQWRTINKPFQDLREDERDGARPSLLFSPMIVETGQPLLISNLDLTWLAKDDNGKPQTVALFDWFPSAHETFKINTAVRLNASFPYISPAVALPTDPERRVVDAGYYDNYGIDLAVAYLSDPDIRNVIEAEYSGVTIIEIRAFPFPKPSLDRSTGLSRAFQFLTTPISGALAARGSTMTFRNEQSLDRLIVDYARTKEAGYLDVARFELDPTADPENTTGEDISLNWYLTQFEFELMERCLETPGPQQGFETLRSHFT